LKPSLYVVLELSTTPFGFFAGEVVNQIKESLC
jgi:hypothetical protein